MEAEISPSFFVLYSLESWILWMMLLLTALSPRSQIFKENIIQKYEVIPLIKEIYTHDFQIYI